MSSTTRTEERKEEVERLLRTKAAHIEGHLTGIQDEVNSILPAVQRVLDNKPLIAVGGALLAGLAVGLVVGGKGRRHTTSEAHRALVEGYIGAVLAEAQRRRARGEPVDAAIRRTLEGNVPVIVYEEQAEGERRGFLGHLGRVVMRSMMGIGLKMGIDYLTSGSLPISTTSDHMEQASEGAVATAMASEAVGD